MTKIKKEPKKEKVERVVVQTAEEFVPKVPKQELFYEIQENGMAKRFANFNNPLICKRKGSVRIEHARRGPGKQANISYSRTYDKTNRITYGIPTGVDDKGKIILKRFYLPEFRVFNLVNADEAEEWAILKHHELITNGHYKIYDEEAIAEAEVTKVSLMRKAIGIAEDMKLKDWIPAARFFGRSPEGMSAIKLQSEIMGIATDTPKELIDYWEDDNRNVISIFNAAKANAIIHHDYLKGWLYKKSLPLGSTEEAAIRYIKNDATFCKSLLDETKRIDIAEKSVLGDKSVATKSTFDLQEEEETFNKEVLNLRIKASNFNIKGYENMDEDQLKERVALAELNDED